MYACGLFLKQILCAIGTKLEALDLSGGLMSPMTDNAISSIVSHCPCITNIGLSLNQMTACTLIPLLMDSSRAEKLTVLRLSLKQVVELLSTSCNPFLVLKSQHIYLNAG